MNNFTITYRDYKNIINGDIMPYLYTFIDDGEFKPVYRGDVLKTIHGKAAKCNDDSWYYCNDTFHDSEIIPLSGMKYNADLAEQWDITYAENTPDAIFCDYYPDVPFAECDEILQKKLTDTFDSETLSIYEDDIGWLLDWLACKEVFPKLFRELQG